MSKNSKKRYPLLWLIIIVLSFFTLTNLPNLYIIGKTIYYRDQVEKERNKAPPDFILPFTLDKSNMITENKTISPNQNAQADLELSSSLKIYKKDLTPYSKEFMTVLKNIYLDPKNTLPKIDAENTSVAGSDTNSNNIRDDLEHLLYKEIYLKTYDKAVYGSFLWLAWKSQAMFTDKAYISAEDNYSEVSKLWIKDFYLSLYCLEKSIGFNYFVENEFAKNLSANQKSLENEEKLRKTIPLLLHNIASSSSRQGGFHALFFNKFYIPVSPSRSYLNYYCNFKGFNDL